MPAEIIDLTSDNEDDQPSRPSSSSSSKRHQETRSTFDTSNQPIPVAANAAFDVAKVGGASVSDKKSLEHRALKKNANTPHISGDGSTRPFLLNGNSAQALKNPNILGSPSSNSHTEHGSHTDDDEIIPAQTTTSTSFRAPYNAISTDNGKGKGRAPQIPEIDLSRLDSDSDEAVTSAGTEAEAGTASDAFQYANGEYSEDEALRRAIALSLPSHPQNHDAEDPGVGSSRHRSRAMELPSWFRDGEERARKGDEKTTLNQPSNANNGVVLDVEHDDDDDDDDKTVSPSPPPPPIPSNQAPAPAHSTVSLSASMSGTESATRPIALNNPVPKPPPVTATFSLTNLDRRSMEAERLARLKRKRAHSTSQEQDGQGSKLAKTTSTSSVEAPGDPPSTSTSTLTPVPSTEQQLPNRYADGVVLKTYISGYPSTQTIDFATLISPSSSLTSCLLSSFIWDFDWLFPHFETRRTKFQLVVHAKTSAQRDALTADFQGVPNVRLCFPTVGGSIKCMHSKLMLLFYEDEDNSGTGTPTGTGTAWKGPRCRIVVPTANLVDFDWGVGGHMENTIWLIDLPARSGPNSLGKLGQGTETHFQESLKAFLVAQTIPEDVLRKLDLFDFSKTAQYGFVHSIGGAHSGQAWRTTGVCGLGRTISELGLAIRDPVQLDYVTSSVGNLNDEFMSSMYLAARGDDGLTEYTRRTSQRGSSQGGGTLDDWKESFRFYYPSEDTVRSSKGGIHKAGTICFTETWWQNPKFPRSNMKDCISVREGLLMHNKIIFVRHASPMQTAQPAKLGWAYVGSANLAESAWGRLVQDKSTKKPKLNCRNWECGVIIPVPAKSNTSSRMRDMDDHQDANLGAFGHLVPVPMRYPSDSVEGTKPWASFNGGN